MMGFRTAAILSLLGLVLTAFPGMAGGSPATRASLTETVRGSVESFVRERVTMPADSVAVTVDMPVFGIEPEDIADFRLDLFSAKRVAGTVPVKVTFILESGHELAYAATARVRAFASVLVAAERLDRHEIVRGKALRREKREVTNLTDAYFSDPEEVRGQRTRRVISPGRIITASDVEEVPLVDRGAGVMVTVVMGRVTVTSKAKALEDGDMGECIKVQDLTTGKRMVGMVAGKGLVVLDESML
jgi:flagella basal body P-ring formation protein FlgA